MPVAALVDECPLYDLEPAEPTAGSTATARDARPAGADAGDELAAARCSPRRASPRKRWAFEQYDSIVRLAHGAPARRPPTPRSCTCPRPGARSPSRSTATGAASPATPTRDGRGGARVRPEPRLRRAPSRSASPTASTSATPRSRTSPGSSTARRRGSPTPARRSACRSSAATSRSTTRPTTGPIYPTPVVGMVGELPDPRARRRARARRGRRDRALRPVRALAGRLGAGEAARRARPGPARRSIAAVAAGDRAGPRRGRAPGAIGAAHDVSDGGLACALAEWRSPAGSALEADLDALVELRGARARRRCSARARAASCSPATRARARGARASRRASTLFVDRRGRRRPDRDLGRRGRGRRRARRRRARLALAAGAARGPAARV